MLLTKQKIQRRIALALILAISLQMGGATAFAAMDAEKATAKNAGDEVTRLNKARQATVRIQLKNDKTVLVNGQKAVNNQLISPGSVIETAAGAEAELLHGTLGTIKVFPKTKMTLSFDDRNFEASLSEGCASLFADSQINGVLITPKGERKSTDNGKQNQLNSCDKDEAAAVLPPGAGGTPGAAAGAGIFSGLPLPALAALLIAGGAGAGAIIYFARRKPRACEVSAVSPTLPPCQ